jgi:hypothetical protein
VEAVDRTGNSSIRRLMELSAKPPSVTTNGMAGAAKANRAVPHQGGRRLRDLEHEPNTTGAGP